MSVSNLCQDLAVFTIRHSVSQELAGLQKYSKTVKKAGFRWWARRDLNPRPIRYERLRNNNLYIFINILGYFCVNYVSAIESDEKPPLKGLLELITGRKPSASHK